MGNYWLDIGTPQIPSLPPSGTPIIFGPITYGYPGGVTFAPIAFGPAPSFSPIPFGPLGSQILFHPTSGISEIAFYEVKRG